MGIVIEPRQDIPPLRYRVVKAIQILDIAMYRYGKSIRAVASGIQNIRDLSVKFGNFIFKGVSVALIQRHGIDAVVGKLIYVGLIFLLIARSDGIQTKRYSSPGRILGRSPFIGHAFASIRDIAGDDRTPLTLRKRKNGRRGSILTRPCFVL